MIHAEDMGGKLVIEDIREAFEKDQRQNEVLELGSIGCAANGASSIPEPGLKGGDVEMFL